MQNTPNDPWLLPMLKAIRNRPGAYLGHENVRQFSEYTRGYRQARIDLGFPEFGDGEREILTEFEAWLKHRLDLAESNWHGWCECIEMLDGTARNMHTFLREFEAFLQTRGGSLDLVSGMWPPDDRE